MIVLNKEIVDWIPGGLRSRTGVGAEPSFGVLDEAGLGAVVTRSPSSSGVLHANQPLPGPDGHYLVGFDRRLRTVVDSPAGTVLLRALGVVLPTSVNVHGTLWNSHMRHTSSWPSRNTQRCFRRLQASHGRPKRLGL